VEKSNVAIVDNSQDVTGALKAILAYAEYAKNDFHFYFFLPKGSKAKNRVHQAGFEVFEFPFLEISKNWKNLAFYLPQLVLNGMKLNKIVNQHKIEIVHINDFYNMVGVVAKMLDGSFKLLTHVRFMPDRFPSMLVKFWMSLNLQYAEAVICVSKAVQALLPNHAKLTVIYDGVIIGSGTARPKRQSKEIWLLYLANFIPGKGQDIAIDVFKKAYQQNSRLRLRFVGGDLGLEKNIAFRKNLKARVKELSLGKLVEFKGPISDVNREMVLADIALNFSESESFSMTCLEALMNGLPLIASDCGGPAELFEQNISGLLVPNKDIEAMCNAILHLAGDEEKRMKFRLNSVKYVKEKFSPNITFSNLMKIYSEVLRD
jgi:glycosyltransferase involved in cell wall biosynthesis